jgi:hypothetical protein
MTAARATDSSTALSPPRDPNAEALNAPRKVVFSRTLSTAGWANTTIASGARLFEDVGKSRPLDLLSSPAFSSGLELEYRRRR